MRRDVGVRKDGGRWCAHIKVGGRQYQRSCDTKKEARQLRAQWEREVREGTFVAPGQRRRLGRLTVASWAAQWVKLREDRRVPVRALRDEKSRLRLHVLPVLGEVELQEELQVRHLRQLFRALDGKVSKTTGKPLSEKTQFNVGEVARKMLADAERHFGEHGVPWRSPWHLLTAEERPSKDSSDTRDAWTRDEAEALISDQRLSLDRRVLYAGPLYTGMRFSEWTGARWGELDARAPELPRLALSHQAKGRALKESKRGERKVRAIPIHPELSKLLEHWRSEGWPALYNRFPTDEDLIIPSSIDCRRHRSQSTTWRQLQIDCERVGVRPLTYHCTRNTFLTLAIEDSPELEHIIKKITHSAKSGAADRYVANRWLAKCRAVRAYQLRVGRRAAVVAYPKAALALGGSLDSSEPMTEALAEQGDSGCRGRDSNPHVRSTSDFKSPAYTDSATPAGATPGEADVGWGCSTSLF